MARDRAAFAPREVAARYGAKVAVAEEYRVGGTQDQFIIAPGIRGLVMLVFTLPSFPYVFKIIRDEIAPPKEVDRATVMAKYLLVKHHDRVGRMADTWEFSDVALPRSRCSEELMEELRRTAPSVLEEEGDTSSSGTYTSSGACNR